VKQKVKKALAEREAAMRLEQEAEMTRQAEADARASAKATTTTTTTEPKDFFPAEADPNGNPVPPPKPVLYGIDPSTGKPREAFGLRLDSEKEIRDGLAPTGLTTEDKKEMAAAMIDATALPGRSARSENDALTHMDEFTSAVKDLSEGVRSGSKNSDIRIDTQWRSGSRTSLKGVGDEEELQELRDSIEEIKRDTTLNMYTGMGSILQKYCWDKDLEVYWAQGNLLSRVALDSVDNYLALLDHLCRQARDRGWTYAKVAVDFHAKKLSEIRSTSLNRLSALLSIYVYLRDSRIQSFNSPKLQEKRNASLLERMAELETSVQVTVGPKCGKCGGSVRVHPPGKKNCPFKNLKDADARRRAGLVEQAHKGSSEE